MFELSFEVEGDEKFEEMKKFEHVLGTNALVRMDNKTYRG
jgi:hypothetical protein